MVYGWKRQYTDPIFVHLRGSREQVHTSGGMGRRGYVVVSIWNKIARSAYLSHDALRQEKLKINEILFDSMLSLVLSSKILFTYLTQLKITNRTCFVK